MKKTIKLSNTPETTNLEICGDLVVKLHVPYSKEEVNIQLNPAVQDYKENQDQPGVKVRQMMVTAPTDDTKTLKLDFKENNVHTVTVAGTGYKIKLMDIGETKFQGQDFPTFEFFIETTQPS